MTEVGPHTFSAMDARKTLAHFDDLWNGYVAQRDRSVAEHLRAPVLEALRGVDPLSATEDELSEPLTKAWTALLQLGPELRAAGYMPGRAEGRVAFLAISNGGVPKQQVPAAYVGWRGLLGDVQQSRNHHGRPFQALCLWSVEVIENFRAQGHPIAPSSAGENITISGIDWRSVRPGVRLRLGTALCEISAFATPCSKNAQWFLTGEYDLMHEDRGPVSRVYATVIEPGHIEPDDPAVLEP